MLCLFQNDRLRIFLTLEEQVILTVFLIDRRIDHAAVLFPVKQLRLAEMPEVRCSRSIDGLRAIVIVCMAGRPVQDIFLCVPVPDDIRCPDTAKLSAAEADQFLLCPGDKIVRRPVRQIGAAIAPDFIPGVMILVAHAVGKAQIGGKNMESSIQSAPDNRHVSDTLVSIIGPENRPTAVHALPVKAIPAQAEIDLFPVRRCLLPKMNKQISLHVFTPSGHMMHVTCYSPQL